MKDLLDILLFAIGLLSLIEFLSYFMDGKDSLIYKLLEKIKK